MDLSTARHRHPIIIPVDTLLLDQAVQRRDQLEKQKALVGKFFQKESKTRSKSESRATERFEQRSETITSSQQSSQQVSMVQGCETQIIEAKQAGMERKQEALKRREEFVSSQTTTV